MFTSIEESLGPEYGESVILDLDATWAESEPRTPLVCILSIGSDPSPQITSLAKAKELGNFYFIIIIFQHIYNLLLGTPAPHWLGDQRSIAIFLYFCLEITET